MNAGERWVVFRLDDGRFALPLAAVVRVVRAVEVTPVPHASEYVLGAINLHGEPVPVCSLRRWFRYPDRELTLTDQLVVACVAGRTVALLVDEVVGVVPSREQELVAAERALWGATSAAGLLRLPEGLMFIPDLNRLLAAEMTPASPVSCQGRS